MSDTETPAGHACANGYQYPEGSWGADIFHDPPAGWFTACDVGTQIAMETTLREKAPGGRLPHELPSAAGERATVTARLDKALGQRPAPAQAPSEPADTLPHALERLRAELALVAPWTWVVAVADRLALAADRAAGRFDTWRARR